MKLPGQVFGGSGALEKLNGLLKEKKSPVAIMTDGGIRKAGILDPVLSQIEKAGKESVILDGVAAEPTYEQAQAVIDQFRETKAEVLVAVGGGSVMDIAKLASLLAGGKTHVKELLDDPLLGEKTVTSIMIPTTAGTGSEATPNSIVAVPEKKVKVGIVNPAMIADYVILDPAMVSSLPKKLVAATGVDALAHAIECFTSNKANPFSDLFALEAFELIFKNLYRMYEDPADEEAAGAMLTGAFYAGAAITASGTTAVHALSYPLGGKYHIPHGVANAMLLIPVMKFNEPACVDRLSLVCDRVGGQGRTKEEKAAWVIGRMADLVQALQIPTSLKEYGVGPEDLEDLVASGMQVTRLLSNNMRTVTESDARGLYQQIL